jgi:hypothetical protein
MKELSLPLLFVGLFVFGVWVITNIAYKTPPSLSYSPTLKTVDTLAVTAKDTASATGKWDYENETDPMTSTLTHRASLTANAPLSLEFPYGEVSAHITLRKKRGNTDVMFWVSKGQIEHDSYDAKIRARFDDAPSQIYKCNTAADGSTETVFIRSESDFIKKLKKSKKLLVEVEFYSNGVHIAEFDTEHLKW